MVLKVISVKAAAAVLSWNDKKFWMLWNIDLPAPFASATGETLYHD